jgi:protein-tyrosine kinase
MNAEQINPRSREESDQEIADTLVLLYKLPETTIRSIFSTQKTLGVGFREAAIHTGLATESELDQAGEWIRRQEKRGRGGRSIVEEALRRYPTGRDLIVWKGERLVPGRELVLAHNPDHPRSEAIRSLRTELLMRGNGRRGGGIFALLSSCAKEGRSQLCAELAIAFAQLGSRTLLMDADLRRPSQHRLFGAENIVGLAQALVDSSTQRIYGVEGFPNMGLLTSGAPPPNPLELLSGVRFERMLNELRRSYEFIVIDTPPVCEFSDGLAVATVAGNVVLLGRTNSTSFHALTETRRKLDTTQARVVGAVINSF